MAEPSSVDSEDASGDRVRAAGQDGLRERERALREVVKALESGTLEASARQRAFIVGAWSALEALSLESAEIDPRSNSQP